MAIIKEYPLYNGEKMSFIELQKYISDFNVIVKTTNYEVEESVYTLLTVINQIENIVRMYYISNFDYDNIIKESEE